MFTTNVTYRQYRASDSTKLIGMLALAARREMKREILTQAEKVRMVQLADAMEAEATRLGHPVTIKNGRVKLARLELEHGVINPGDAVWYNHAYLVSFMPYSEGEVVFADNEQDAIDTYADHANEQNWVGLFLSDFEEEDYPDGVLYVGNYGLPVSATDVTVREV